MRDLACQIKGNAWPGALVSLNYERLLELSLAAEGVIPFIGSPPDKGPSVELCLPHGCCHIFCESVRGSASGISFTGTGVTTRGSVKIVANPAEHAQRIRTDAFPPAMSYFDPAKLTTSGVNFIEAQRARYDAIVKSVKVVVIVGVKVRPHDKHLWEALAATNAEKLSTALAKPLVKNLKSGPAISEGVRLAGSCTPISMKASRNYAPALA